MTLEEHVYSKLAAAALITTLAPASRIKPPGNWQNLDRPYIVHFPISVDPIYTHDGGLQALKVRPYQVSCYADQYDTARALANAVIAILSGQNDGVTFFLTNQLTSPFDFEPETQHIAVLFDAFEAL